MKGQIQLVLATIGLTVLIWVYADQQGYKTVRLQVAVTVGTPPGVVAHVTGAAPDAWAPFRVDNTTEVNA
ncbi:MAG TPA: hypothetical protein PL151_17015, partial [Phycisphaerae bacterium]|nr:hypothetical protein [Phycisphaerae bacterium]